MDEDNQAVDDMLEYKGFSDQDDMIIDDVKDGSQVIDEGGQIFKQRTAPRFLSWQLYSA